MFQFQDRSLHNINPVRSAHPQNTSKYSKMVEVLSFMYGPEEAQAFSWLYNRLFASPRLQQSFVAGQLENTLSLVFQFFFSGVQFFKNDCSFLFFMFEYS